MVRSQAEKEKELEDALEIEYRTIDHILFSDDKFINAGGSTLLVALCLQERYVGPNPNPNPARAAVGDDGGRHGPGINLLVPPASMCTSIGCT